MIDIPKVDEIEVSYDHIGRVYHTPDGDYHSVTTVLGASGDKTFLDDWKKRIGVEQAEQITRQAAAMGTDFHQLGEDYLLKKPLSKVQWMAEHMFKSAIPVLDKNITAVHAVEVPLWHRTAKVAGRVDAIVDWNGEPAIFDYKCIGHHNPEWLNDYWLQTTIYAACVKDMTGIDIKRLVLCCANKKNLTTKSFTSEVHKYIKEAVARIKKFHEIHKNA